MRVRKGFVSNSSSSSFILVLDKKPKNVKEMKELLFKDEEFYYDPFYDRTCDYFSLRPEKYLATEVASTVFEDIKDQKPKTIKELAEELSSGYSEYTLKDGTSAPNYEQFAEGINIDWDAYEEACVAFSNKLANTFFSETDKEYYIVEYADDGPYSSALEHGDLFKNVKHYKVSHH